jgi:dTDP-4-dehydrorhamnose 3,5-epimerase
MMASHDTGRFVFHVTPLSGVHVVQRKAAEDARGFLSRIYCRDEFAHVGMPHPLVQINHTLTRQCGTVRGMHFQYPPYAETKLVSCLSGKVFDVAIDLRRGSSTFLKWHAEVLSAENRKSLLIPEGFAHGFQTLTEDCELIYIHTAAYDKTSESGVRFDDPVFGIRWPLAAIDISDRDRIHALVDDAFSGIET